MSTSVRINFNLDMIDNADGTTSVKLGTQSQVLQGGQIINTGNANEQISKIFKIKAEAETYFAELRMKFNFK